MTTNKDLYDKLQAIGEDVAVLKEHVVGNGGPGLVRRISKLEKQSDQTAGVLKFLGWGVPILVAAGGIVGAFIKALMV